MVVTAFCIGWSYWREILFWRNFPIFLSLWTFEQSFWDFGRQIVGSVVSTAFFVSAGTFWEEKKSFLMRKLFSIFFVLCWKTADVSWTKSTLLIKLFSTCPGNNLRSIFPEKSDFQNLSDFELNLFNFLKQFVNRVV